MDLDSYLTEAVEILSNTPFIGAVYSYLDFFKDGTWPIADLNKLDGHNDWMHLIRGYYDNKLDERFGPQRNLAGHVDLKRLIQGKLGGAFWSVYVDWYFSLAHDASPARPPHPCKTEN